MTDALQSRNPLPTETHTLRSEVDSLRTQFDSLRTQFDSVRTQTNSLRTQLDAVLAEPFRGRTPDALLEHFHSRAGVEYFPVIAPEDSQRERVNAVLGNTFSFNGESHTLAEPLDWLSNPSHDIEWHILLHKFYFAVGLGARWHKTHDPRYLHKWIALTDSWIAQTPVGFIAADVTGRRVQNWIYAHYFFVTRNRPVAMSAQFYARFLLSLHAQVQHLREHLHAARNHRTLELYAIFLAGVVFPEFTDAQTWRNSALAELTGNVVTDLLDDGVQCELSTDYHHIVLRNWLCVKRLAALNGIAVPRAMDEGLIRALEFSMHAHKPDGEVPSFSDGDVWSYRDLLLEGFELYGREDMLYVATAGARGRPPQQRARAFAASGYHVIRGGWGEERAFRDEQYLMLDCGPLGAGNHGHFDCLSFELAAFGRSLVVDPGRYTYDEAGEINWRALFRGTGAHNTVLIDGRNQTRYEPGPSKFKVRGPAPDVQRLAWHDCPEFTHLHARARSNEYPVTHERIVHFVRSEYWLISDFLYGHDEHTFDLLFHLDTFAHQNTSIALNGSTLTVTTPNLLIAQCRDGRIEPSLEDGFVSRRYGEKLPAPIVRLRQSGVCASFHTVLYPYRRQPPPLQMHEVPVWSDQHDATTTSDARAFAIHIGSGAGSVVDHWFVAPQTPVRPLRFAATSCAGSFAWQREDAFGETTRIHRDPGARPHDLRIPISASEGAH